MMTKSEAISIKAFRALVKDGRADLISKDQKQWILDLLARENLPVKKSVIEAANNSGFNTSKLKSIL